MYDGFSYLKPTKGFACGLVGFYAVANLWHGPFYELDNVLGHPIGCCCIHGKPYVPKRNVESDECTRLGRMDVGHFPNGFLCRPVLVW